MSTTGSQITLTIAIAMILAFSIAIVGFSISFASDTNADISVNSDPSISSFYGESKQQSSSFSSESNDTYQSIIDTTVEPGSDVVQSAAPFAVTPRNLINALTEVILIPKKVIFGGDSSPFEVFFTVFIGAVSFIFALLIYKSWRGNP